MVVGMDPYPRTTAPSMTEPAEPVIKPTPTLQQSQVLGASTVEKGKGHMFLLRRRNLLLR